MHDRDPPLRIHATHGHGDGKYLDGSRSYGRHREPGEWRTGEHGPGDASSPQVRQDSLHRQPARWEAPHGRGVEDGQEAFARTWRQRTRFNLSGCRLGAGRPKRRYGEVPEWWAGVYFSPTFFRTRWPHGEI